MAIENNEFFNKVSLFAMLTGLLKRDVIFWPNAGAPTNGTAGTGFGKAGPGSLCFDYTNGQVYINTNTKASPTWTKVADSVGDLALARGFVLRGSAAGVAEAYDANNSGQILVGDGTDIVSVAVSGDATLAANGTLTLAAQIINGVDLANVANVNVIGGVPVIHRITCTALTGDVDVVLTHKTRITNVWAVGTAAGGAGDTVQVKNGANAITNALDMNVADQTVVRVTTIDDAQWDIAAAGTLRVTGASGVNAEVFVEGIRIA